MAKYYMATVVNFVLIVSVIQKGQCCQRDKANQEGGPD